MPYIEIKSGLKAPAREALNQITDAVKRELKMAPTSRMRLVWNHVVAGSSVGMGDALNDPELSIIAIFYTRNHYDKNDIRRAMSVLNDGILRATKAPPKSVLVLHVGLAPGAILSSNGFWEGGENFSPKENIL